MAEPFLGEIRLMSFDFAPKGWALCNGQHLPINQNQALFALLGTTYGGNAQTTFALPDLRGKVPIHVGGYHTLGQQGGEQAHTLTASELPAHAHPMLASASNADVVAPGDNVLARTSQLYGAAAQLVALHPSSSGPVGGSQPHQNMQPYLTVSACIALQGIFPSQN